VYDPDAYLRSTTAAADTVAQLSHMTLSPATLMRDAERRLEMVEEALRGGGGGDRLLGRILDFDCDVDFDEFAEADPVTAYFRRGREQAGGGAGLGMRSQVVE